MREPAPLHKHGFAIGAGCGCCSRRRVSRHPISSARGAEPATKGTRVGYAETLGGTRYVFADLKTLLARATPSRSGDRLAGIAAGNMTERVAAQRALADLPLRRLIEDPVIPYEADEITRLIGDTHDGHAFATIAAMTVGELLDWLLSDAVDTAALTRLAAGLAPEIGADGVKIMRLQGVVRAAAKCLIVPL